MSAQKAKELGFVDLVFDGTPEEFRQKVIDYALRLMRDVDMLLHEKRLRRERDEAEKPLKAYREEELKMMHNNFYGFDPSYHIARYYFVRKTPHYRTPYYLARHRLSQ